MRQRMNALASRTLTLTVTVDTSIVSIGSCLVSTLYNLVDLLYSRSKLVALVFIAGLCVYASEHAEEERRGCVI